MSRTSIRQIYDCIIKFCYLKQIEQVKLKIYHFVGTPTNDQALVLKNENGEVVCELANDNMLLGAYPIDSGMEIYCVDTNPFSKAKGGAYEDVSLVKKYEMSEEEYDKRKGTVRDYKREMLKKDPNFKFKTFTVDPDNAPPGPETVEQFVIGNRCEVNPGGRRGEIKWKGVWENEEDKGYWVGVQFDEPVGQGTGKHKGKEYFSCEDKYGSFVRGKNVTSILYYIL